MTDPSRYVNENTGRSVLAVRVSAENAPRLGTDLGTHVRVPGGDTVPYGDWIVTDAHTPDGPRRAIPHVVFWALYRPALHTV